MQAAGDGSTCDRNAGIDLLRGALVVAVILGHFSELTARQSFLTWIGAGVRMPLFIGLTGYLFNVERARATPLSDLLRKYHRRLVLPWLIACVVHLIVTQQLSVLTPVSIFVQPPFHLWFVPVIMLFILTAALVRLPPLTMLGVAIPCSILAMYLLGVGHHRILGAPWLPDRRFFIYPIYFFYGLWIARRPRDQSKERAAMVLAPIGFLWWCALFRVADLPAEVAAELTTCLPLICLLPMVRRMTLRHSVLATVGRDSLFFYLWHPMAFGLLAAGNVTGVPMLMLSLLMLAAARALCVRQSRIAPLFGLLPRDPPLATPPLGRPALALREPV